MYQMTLKETILTSEEYVKLLQEADSAWEVRAKTPDFTFEVLKDPTLRTRPSERERYLVLKNTENNRTVILKNQGVRADTREGYAFDHATVGEKGFFEYWNKGAVNE
jgi:hypothetical protein